MKPKPTFQNRHSKTDIPKPTFQKDMFLECRIVETTFQNRHSKTGIPKPTFQKDSFWNVEYRFWNVVFDLCSVYEVNRPNRQSTFQNDIPKRHSNHRSWNVVFGMSNIVLPNLLHKRYINRKRHSKTIFDIPKPTFQTDGVLEYRFWNIGFGMSFRQFDIPKKTVFGIAVLEYRFWNIGFGMSVCLNILRIFNYHLVIVSKPLARPLRVESEAAREARRSRHRRRCPRASTRQTGGRRRPRPCRRGGGTAG